MSFPDVVVHTAPVFAASKFVIRFAFDVSEVERFEIVIALVANSFEWSASSVSWVKSSL